MHNFKNKSILGFDVSNNIISISLTVNGGLLAYFEDMRYNMQAELFVHSVDSLLKKHKLSYQDFQYVGFTNGPGSFTGIRVGLAFAAGIKSLLPNTKVVSVTNFELAHYRAVRQVKKWDKVVVLLNAYRDQLYYQIFDKNTKTTPSIIDISGFSELAEQTCAQSTNHSQDRQNIIFTGSGLPLVYLDIKKIMLAKDSKCDIQALPRFPIVKSSYICKYIEYCLQKNIELNFNLEPLYIRHPDAKAQC